MKDEGRGVFLVVSLLFAQVEEVEVGGVRSMTAPASMRAPPIGHS